MRCSYGGQVFYLGFSRGAIPHLQVGSRKRCLEIWPAREPRTGKSSKVPQSALESALKELRVLFCVEDNRKTTLESSLGSTRNSTPISESTLQSTPGALSEMSLFSAP